MRKRMSSQKYLRDVNKYILKIFISEKDYYVAVKEIIEVDAPFILSNGLRVIDNGYYIVEVLPKNENYAMRVFLNEKKEILEYYFDISNGNGLDENTKIPYYDDLFLDVTVTNDEIELADEEELEAALLGGNITKEIYNLAKITADNLIKEIQNGKNIYFNMNLSEYL